MQTIGIQAFHLPAAVPVASKEVLYCLLMLRLAVQGLTHYTQWNSLCQIHICALIMGKVPGPPTLKTCMTNSENKPAAMSREQEGLRDEASIDCPVARSYRDRHMNNQRRLAGRYRRSPGVASRRSAPAPSHRSSSSVPACLSPAAHSRHTNGTATVS